MNQYISTSDTEIMNSIEGELKDSLADLRHRLDQLPPLEQEQISLLNLAGRETHEHTWQNILAYFLDPAEAHGFDDALLQYFLQTLDDKDIIDGIPHYHIDNISIDQEVSMDEGVIDIVVRYPGRWFVAIEMKVLSPEGGQQTEKYAETSRLGNESIKNYPEAKRTFVYLAPVYNTPDSMEFFHLTWSELTRTFRQPLGFESGSQSVRGHTQLRAFTNTIIEQFNITMNPSKDKNAVRERIRLYNEYRDEIEELEQSFNELELILKNQWENRIVNNYDEVEWGETWHTWTNTLSKTQFLIYRSDWVYQPSGPADPERAPFVHLEARVSAEKLRNGFFTYHVSPGSAGNKLVPTENVPGTRDDWRKFLRDYCSDNDEFKKSLPDNATAKSSTSTLSSMKYGDIRNEEDFYRKLEQAIEDHLEVAEFLTQLLASEVTPILE